MERFGDIRLAQAEFLAAATQPDVQRRVKRSNGWVTFVHNPPVKLMVVQGARERTPVKADTSMSAKFDISGIDAEAPATAAHYLRNFSSRMNLPLNLKRSRSPANFRRRAREYAFFFQAGFFMRSKETTAAQQANMAVAIKVQVTADVNGGELGPLR
jgi:hypothetical protein